MPSCLICCARARLASWIGVVSCPCRFARATSSPDVFCCALQPLELGNQPPARGLERRDLLERLVGIEAAVAQAGADLLDVIADEGRIEHGTRSSIGLPIVYSRGEPIPLLRSCRDLHVRKAVFPAAGLGTRFLPATKAQPKEMLPLVDKPIIQYGVEEAVASGVDNIILVTGRGKNAIEDHFDVSVELESFLEARGKREQLDEIRKISNLINFAYVRQGEPLGLGHAVLVDARAGRRRAVRRHPRRRRDRRGSAGDQTDDRRVRARRRAGARGRARAARRDLELRRHRDRAGRVASATASTRSRDLVEKPPRDEAPSDLAIIGRYVLTPDIFPALAATKSDRTGEIQLTNGLRELLKSRPIYACEVKGVRHDTGNKLGFLKAVVYFALRRPDLADKFSAYLVSLDLDSAGRETRSSKPRRTPAASAAARRRAVFERASTVFDRARDDVRCRDLFRSCPLFDLSAFVRRFLGSLSAVSFGLSPSRAFRLAEPLGPSCA